jgi:hypothetical protein
MHEQYLDETQVAQALAVLNAGAALVLRNSMTFPESYQSVLAAQLALPQADAVNAKADVRVDYLAHLCERIGTTDMEAVVAEMESEPYLDSLCYELACVVKLPTFEHWYAELREQVQA